MSSSGMAFDGVDHERGISRRALLSLGRAHLRHAPGGHWIRVHRTAMACRFEVVLADEHAAWTPVAFAALDEADRLESLLTVFRDTSEIARINRTAAAEPVTVDPAVFDILCRSRELHDATGGAFDITSGPLSRCWGFLQREGRLPAPAALESARAIVGMPGVELDAAAGSVRFSRRGMELNLGSIGKGYALDAMRALLTARGITSALLSAGGSSIVGIGGDRAGWPIDLRPRLVRAARPLRVYLRGAAMATSGAGEQFVEVDGRRYGHVIDPRTGWPASGVLSATVMTSDAAAADALSTAFLVGGAALAARCCDARPDTLALLALEHDATRFQTFGACAGAQVVKT